MKESVIEMAKQIKLKQDDEIQCWDYYKSEQTGEPHTIEIDFPMRFETRDDFFNWISREHGARIAEGMEGDAEITQGRACTLPNGTTIYDEE